MKRDSFASSFGILVALAGSAVGLGNLWRFPYLVGNSGGAAFIVIYLAIVIFLALPIMYSEILLGRKAQANIIGGFDTLAPKSKWGIVGVLCMICTIMIISFYSVVGGWTIDYLVKSIGFSFTSAGAEVDGMFQKTVGSVWRPLFYMLLFVGLSAFIVISGIKNGIEKFSKIMMPVLFVLVILIAVRSVTLPNSSAGIAFLFKPDFSKISAGTFLDALGQAFFSLSIGCGTVFTYGSYIKSNENLVKISIQTAGLDTFFAIIAGVAIMPAVFAFGISPGEGPGLVFITLPHIFAQMPLGGLVAILFFFVLFIAAITSAISLIEVVVAFVIERFNMKRGKAVCIVSALIAFLAVFCSLSQSVLADVKIFGNNIFDLFDKTSANILMPLGALCFVLFAGWRLKKPEFMSELTNEGELKFAKGFKTYIYFSVRYLAPLVVSIILVSCLLSLIT